jgi:triosephosphate isomerase
VPRFLVAGNWKMHGDRAGTLRLVEEIIAGLPAAPEIDVVVCPPAVYLDAARQAAGAGPVGVGAQDTSAEPSGAFTGDVSAAMLADIGCDCVLVGHSERRHGHGESNALVADKFAAALGQGVTPVLCVGEQSNEREADETEAVIGAQIDAVVDACGIAAFAKAVVAYEPVWAIGTGRTATPEQAQAVHAFIRQRLASRDASVAAGVQILYGGSVKPDNAASLFAMNDVNGALVGGASLKAESFLAICDAARQAATGAP